MSQITADQKEVVPSACKKYFTVKNFASRNREIGTWPDSESTIWALRGGSPENGFGEAFITIGRRVLIDEEKFWEAVSRLQEAKHVSSCKLLHTKQRLFHDL